MASVIKERLAAGKTVCTMHVVGFATPRIIELFGTLGKFHGYWFDQEHSAISHQDLETMLIACRATGMDAFARVAPTDYATVMRPMEAGCSGVMIAQVRHAGRSAAGSAVGEVPADWHSGHVHR